MSAIVISLADARRRDEDAFGKALRKVASERPPKASEKRKAPSKRKQK